MRRWLSPIVILIGLALLPAPLAAQDDARDQIAAAYEDAESWQTYVAELEESFSYVATAQGYNTLYWQRHNQAINLLGGYDRSDDTGPVARLSVMGRGTTAIDNNGDASESNWQIELDVAALGGDMFWQGTITAPPDEDLELPAEWDTFDADDAEQIPPLADLNLVESLQPGAFAVDVESWLEAAESVEGPERAAIDRRTQADLYTIEIALADLPDALRAPFWPLTRSESPVVAADDLREALLEDSALTWYVALDPATGRLLLQTVDVRLSAEMGADAIAEGFRSLSVEASQSQTVVFSGINEPLEEIDLPD